ncbi:glycosyltransferase family 2 protein [Synechococcus sp. CCY 9618]|uniref:glycosyltransferase family 2 protein n=1 Tax=Synechococcus sp. CCY 9618 TaxID=2815602 RepID=UPI001C22BBFE|nr:glycosyltransferase family 2 protein [Synechococcus sp. CCY 9618]
MTPAAVSIICPYRNGAAFLPGLIADVGAQEHPGWELLLIDDGSTDGGADLAAGAAARDRRIRALTAPPRPPGAPAGPWWPRNHGLAQARHDLIAFLDVDDRWHPAKLRRQLDHQRRCGAALSVTGYARFDSSGSRLLGWRLPPPRFGYGQLRATNAIPMLTLLIERRLLVEGFQPCPHEDYLCWLNMFRRHRDLHCVTIPELLAFYGVHPGNLTGARWRMPLWAYDVYRAHGLGRSTSLLSLLPWGLHQVSSLLRSRRQPLRTTLAAALRAEPPLPLPPAGSS